MIQAITVCLESSNMDRSIGFYATILGLPLKFRHGNEWCEFDAGKISIGLCATDEGAPHCNTPQTPIVFQVHELTEFKKRLKDSGIRTGPTKKSLNGRYFLSNDPDGYFLQFIQLNTNAKN